MSAGSGMSAASGMSGASGIPWLPEVFLALFYEDKHSEDSKPETAHDKPLAPRILLRTNILQIINFSYDNGC